VFTSPNPDQFLTTALPMEVTAVGAHAIILPITGWLFAHLGRRNYFVLSIAVSNDDASQQHCSCEKACDDPHSFDNILFHRFLL
jgi:hypothetical protein